MQPIWPLIGVLVGWLLNIIYSLFAEIREARKQLRIAAFRCLERLHAIKETTSLGDKKKVSDEIYHLGKEQNEYFDAIAAFSSGKKAHWDISRRVKSLLIHHNLDDVEDLIKDLEAIIL